MKKQMLMAGISAGTFIAAFFVEDLFKHTELIYLANAWLIGAFITSCFEE